jgi:head-tail adaptor
MYPGKRPHRAVFSVPSVEFDEIGNETGAYETIGSAWVSLKPLTNRWRTYVESSGKSAEVTHECELARPSFDIPPTARLQIGSRTYQVSVHLDVPNTAETVLMVSEKRP